MVVSYLGFECAFFRLPVPGHGTGVNDFAIASLFLPLDLIADHTANCGTTYRADRAAAGQYSTKDGARTGADCRTFISRRHAGTSRQAKHEGDRHRMNSQFFYRVHM
jgi:hypothetical protein